MEKAEAMQEGKKSLENDGSHGGSYSRSMTWIVATAACLVAACGGFIFGFDIRFFRGAFLMPKSFAEFFKVPDVNYRYCLPALSYAPISAGVFSYIWCRYTARRWGRPQSMLVAGISYVAGIILSFATGSFKMFIVGRILLGVGSGFIMQIVPLYLGEMALREEDSASEVVLFVGNVASYIITNEVKKEFSSWSWSLSLAIGAVSGVMLIIGGLSLPDTPKSLIERNRSREAHAVLQKITGVSDVDVEYNDLVKARKDASLESALEPGTLRNTLVKMVLLGTLWVIATIAMVLFDIRNFSLG